MGLSAPETCARRHSLLVLFIPIFLFALAVRLGFACFLVPDGLGDDGYITLRYAANLAEGNGFVYNQGESVWGTTTPLFTLLLALCATVFGVSALEVSALVLGLAASVVYWVWTLLVLERQNVPRVLTVPVMLVILFSPAYFGNSLSGMETPLVLALMALSLFAYTTDRPVLLGILCGLLLLARIDTLIWIGVLGGGFILRHVRTNPRPVLWALVSLVLVALPWHVFAYWKFHSLIPHSLVGKAVSHEAFSVLDWSFFVRFYGIYFPVGRLGSFAWLGILLTLPLVLLGFRTLWRDYALLRPLGVFFFAFTVTFLGARAPMYMWYFPPSQWVAVLLFGLGLYTAWNLRPAVSANRMARLAPYWVLTGVVLAYSAVGDHRLWETRNQNHNWANLGNYINEQTPAGSRVFLEHIGLVGFKTGRPILDNMGLVSPEIVALKRAHPNNDQWFPEALTRFRPDVVVLYAPQDPNHAATGWQPETKTWFDKEYRLAKEVSSSPKSYVYFRNETVPDLLRPQRDSDPAGR